ncbi:MAG: prolipoprotein diacylglyceryl transferase [Bacillota bacterium]
MRPILFTIFDFPVRSYGLFIAIGFLAGLWLAKRVAARRRPEYVPLIEEFAFVAFVSAIAGARIWEVTFTWEAYRDNLWHIFALWHGGLSIQGAIVGGALAAFWFARKHKLSFWDFADTLVPGVLLGQAIGRIGSCFLNGDAYGKPTGSSFGVIYAPGTPAYEAFGPVRLWPAELFEGFWDLALMFLMLRLLKQERPQGSVVLWYAILYSVGRFTLEFLRADSLTFMGLKAAQVTSLLIATAAAVGLLLMARRSRHTTSA